MPMYKWFFFNFFSLCFLCVAAQNGANPFELKARLDSAAQVVESGLSAEDMTSNGNPFELNRRPQRNLRPETPREDVNPFEVLSPTEETEPLNSSIENKTKAIEEENTAVEDIQSGSRLVITIILLALVSLCFLYFQSLYVKAYRALFNDNLLSQLYREREAGTIGSFLITYTLFFLAVGFFTCLAAQHFGYMPVDNLWQQSAYLAAGIGGIFVLKHIFLAILGYVFPLKKETSRYSFTIMIFAIIMGLILTTASVLLAYAPAAWRSTIIVGFLGLILLLYLLRSLRGLFIANRFVFKHQFHFLSYICAVEIGPALCLFKLLTDF